MLEISPLIRKVAVLGAGVMGAQIAAHLANAGVACLLLDILPPGNPAGSARRNQVAQEGLARIQKFRPSPFFAPELASKIEIGNLEDDLPRLSQVDLIIEAVVERLDVKRQLFQTVEKVRGKETIVATNTSGLMLSTIAERFSLEFRRHFLGLHFFNPPRYMKLLEITALPDTLPEVVDSVSGFGRKNLGKSIVHSKDTPNFIANRIGVFSVSYILHLMLEQGYSLEEVEELTGPLSGKPKSATFRTLDLIGLDTFSDVSRNLQTSLPNDSMASIFQLPKPVEEMVRRGWVGEKAGQGFYKKIKRADGSSEILVLDFSTMEYRPRQPVAIPSVLLAKFVERLPDRIKILAAAKDRGGEFFWKTTAAVLSYSANRAPEICDQLLNIDQAMRWGFRWELGPFEFWDQIGFEPVAQKIASLGFSLPPWVVEMKNAGKQSFYLLGAVPAKFYDLRSKDYQEIPADPEMIHLSRRKGNSSAILRQNPSGGILDLGDKTLCAELHSKGNVLGEETFALLEDALAKLEENYEILLIGTEQEDFSLGANLLALLLLAQQKEWAPIEQMIRRFQRMNQKIKYSRKPVIALPRGKALGGGCEMILHAVAACASAETYLGLVETGVGLIPAGGGVKELVCRATEKKSSTPAETLQILLQLFLQTAYAKVSSSALEAKKFHYLRESDSICMNDDSLFFTAKQQGLRLVEQGYVPLEPRTLTAFGKSLLDPIASQISKLVEEKKIGDFEAQLANKLAYVMAGGDSPAPRSVSEEHFLDLERETFLTLCGEKKTQEKMKRILEHTR